ncbi:MAG: hypothetical protein IGQ45_02020 [Cyanobacterium sp. T60_A2020_053]|nr:hypothetical protein [Cyanobacterium sp. T60_A2020_053]
MTTTADEVWKLLAELTKAQQETERRFQETERRFRETERVLKEASLETSQQIKQVNRQLGILGNRLGEYVEWQVRPSAVKLFRERGIDVHELHSDISVKRVEGGLEIDLLVVNNTEVVLVEIKSKLNQRDIDEHLERLSKFKRFMPRYQDVKAYGAVGAMVVKDEVANYATQNGLFVLAQNGENITITNSENFEPHIW